jgi:hypothetical protein
MKLKFGMIVTDGRGKLGGHYASVNKSGHHASTHAQSVKKNNTVVSASRLRWGKTKGLWGTLTQLQQNQWKVEAANWKQNDQMGSIISLSGQQLFLKVNNNLNMAGAASISVPGLKNIVTPPSFTCTAVVSTGRITLTYPAAIGAAVGYKILAYATPLLSNGRSVAFSQYRFMQIISPAGQTTDRIDAAWLALFGTLIAGARLFIRIRTIDLGSGASSFYIINDCVVTA